MIMAKNLKLLGSIFVTVVVVFIVNALLVDDEEEIQEQLQTLEQPAANLAHIEFLEDDQAIAFYEWGSGDHQQFGSAQFKKGLFGWTFAGGSTGIYPKGAKFSWGFSNLEPSFSDHTDLIRGKILDTDIEAIKVTTDEGKEYDAQVVDYSGKQRFWFLVTEGEDLIGSTIEAVSPDGQVIEQLIK